MALFNKKLPFHRVNLGADKLKVQYRVIEHIGKVECFVFTSDSNVPAFRGVAKCNLAEGDLFDAEYGKALAQERAFKKVLRTIERCRDKETYNLYDSILDIDDEFAKIEYKIKSKCFMSDSE